MRKTTDTLGAPVSDSGTVGTSRTPVAVQGPKQLTEENVVAICELVADGVPQTAAAGSLGIPRRTLQHWLEKGRREDAREPYMSFAERLQLALDSFHASRVKQLHAAGSDDPRVIQWELERRFRDEWADPNRGALNVQVNVMSSPEWREMLQRIADVLREQHPDALRTLAAEFGYVPERPAIEAA